MKVAIIYDRVNKFGGAERILLSLHEIWPEAPLYTAIYDSKVASWSEVFKIKTTFLKYIPFTKNKHEFFITMTSYAFESMDLDKYEIVISVTSSDAKSVVTKPGTLHLCYCLTPTRYLWSNYNEYLEEPGFGNCNYLARVCMRYAFSKLRFWDSIECSRPDYYIAISKNVADRINTYYHDKSYVVYPPIDTDKFSKNDKSRSDFFLIVSRLVPYKKIDYVIQTFNLTGVKLKIIGSGIDEIRLKKMSKNNIEFISGNLTDKELCCYYQNCRALIFPGEEDFGLTTVEAQACGKPVIAYNRGGSCETVISGITGELYENQNVDSLLEKLTHFNDKKYFSENCVKNASNFSKKNFKLKFKNIVSNLWNEYKINL